MSRMAGPPVPLTSLIGRDRERALARTMLLRDDVRLMTLTGPGGIGKTRLAIQLAADMADDFEDGVCFVSLDVVRDATLVAAAIAHAVAVQPTGATPVHDAAASALRTARMLLVVDNFEHVVAAAPYLSGLLTSCPRLKILVTSRVLLRLSGEHTLPIPPLSYTDPHSPLPPDELTHLEAIQLFVERVRAVNPAFALSESSAPHVAEICRRLDGLPLAIELVAPRVRHLGLPALLERLERRLPLLTGGPGDQPTRLQTMRNAIAWGHDLLAPREQRLLRRLAVFTGGFSLEAAERVAGDVAVEPGEDDRCLPIPSVIDALGTLIDASLLQTETSSDGSARYRMLETIREYALERLETNGEAGQIQRAHATFFLAVAERHEHATILPHGERFLTLLEADHANLRAAFGWLEESGESGLLLRLAAALGRFWVAMGHYQEGHESLERALSQRGSVATDRARALVAFGFIKLYLGMGHEAETSLAAGLAGCRGEVDTINVARALIGLGALATIRGDFVRGTALLEECIVVARTIGDPRLAGIMDGWAQINLADTARALGDHALADTRLRSGLRRLRDAGDTAGTVVALGDLGDLTRDQGDHARALALYREALELSKERSSTAGVTHVIEAVGIVAIAVGQTERGVRLLGAAETMRERTGLRFAVAEHRVALERARTAARVALGEEEFATAWTSGQSLGPAEAIEEAAAPFTIPTGPIQGHPSLTRRETEILQHLATGQTDAAIAAMLFISVRTVENHVAHILGKLGVRTRAAAVQAAGAVPPAPDRPT